MKIELDEHAIEGTAYGIVVSFWDSAGAAATPKTLKWSLTDTAGKVVNNRKDVVVMTPTSVETIVLKGDDLKILAAANMQEFRLLLISGTYDDTVLGLDCIFRQPILFTVENCTEVVT